MLKLHPAQAKELFYLREYQKNEGKKSFISALVRDAIGEYLVKNKNDVEKGEDLVKIREKRIADTELKLAKKRIELSKKRIHPEKLALIKKMM